MTARTARAASARPRPRLALALMVTAQFMVILDLSIVNVALPSIERAMRFSTTGVEGVITAYATAFGGVLILGGRLADLLGRRRMFVAGSLAFGVSSLACAAASSAMLLIVARVAQGLSAALLAPAALALVTTTFSEGTERTRALGSFGVAAATGFVCGQVFGGMLTDVAGWRSIFIINVPIATLTAALALRAIEPDGIAPARRAPDISGAVLITAAVALLVWAPTRAAQRGWQSGAFLLPVLGSLVLLVAFAILQTRRSDPLVRLALLRSRWLLGANTATAVTGALNGAVVLLYTLFLQRVHGYTALRAGLALVPMGLAGLVTGTRFAAPLITRYGVRAVLTTALLVSAGAIASLSRLPSEYWLLLPALVVTGSSFNAASVATTVAVSTGVAAADQGVVAAVRQTAFQMGVALGVAMLLSIAASHTGGLLDAAHPPGQEAALTAGYRLSMALLAVLAAFGGLAAFATLHPRP